MGKLCAHPAEPFISRIFLVFFFFARSGSLRNFALRLEIRMALFRLAGDSSSTQATNALFVFVALEFLEKSTCCSHREQMGMETEIETTTNND